nr:hypothetical protein Itr_chr14CG24410 [Ipomoea trifida]
MSAPELLPVVVDGFHEIGDSQQSVGARGTAQVCNGNGLRVVEAGVEACHGLLYYGLCHIDGDRNISELCFLRAGGHAMSNLVAVPVEQFINYSFTKVANKHRLKNSSHAHGNIVPFTINILVTNNSIIVIIINSNISSPMNLGNLQAINSEGTILLNKEFYFWQSWQVGDYQQSVGARGTSQVCNRDGLRIAEAAGVEACYGLFGYWLCHKDTIINLEKGVIGITGVSISSIHVKHFSYLHLSLYHS